MKKPPSPWAALDALHAAAAEPTGPEWFTLYDYAERYNINTKTADSRLRAFVRAGRMEMWSGSGMNKSGRRSRMTKFRLTK